MVTQGWQLPTIVSLNVGGHFFTTRLSTLLKDEGSMLAAMFSGRYKVEMDKEGRYFIDRDGRYFGYILNYLRDASLPKPCVALQVYREADYFQLEQLVRELECYPSLIPHIVIKEQKRDLAESYHHWKRVLLETTQRKFHKFVKFAVGRDCVITVTRYASKKDCSRSEGVCRSFISLSDDTKNYQSHQFFSVNDTGEKLEYYIGTHLPAVDFIVPNEEISDCHQFTSLVEKDLRLEGFCVSGSLSHAWKCVLCDMTGTLHQLAFKWVLPYPNTDSEKIMKQF